MALESPAILIAPSASVVDPEHIKALSEALYRAQPGQVIAAPFAVQIYHRIDGLWIESGDLPNILVKNTSDIPADEGEPWRHK